MTPTLSEGDFLIATVPTARSIRRGSLVVVVHPDLSDYEMVKRVVGVPGDRASGSGERVLGPDEFWVEGDDAMASTDSRSFGPVAGRAIRGLVRLRYWPPGRLVVFA